MMQYVSSQASECRLEWIVQHETQTAGSAPPGSVTVKVVFERGSVHEVGVQLPHAQQPAL